VQDVMARTGVPSVSLGIAKGNQIVFTRAYGQARLDPPLPAAPDMLYAIGSISKQFTAACLLLLQEDGKLRIGDPVGKYFPELTRAHEVTIRNILSHTSGYRDYAPRTTRSPSGRGRRRRSRSSTSGPRCRSISSPARSTNTATPTSTSPASSSRRRAASRSGRTSRAAF
jgi:CubicO group peptidase (beta-lactamase class C family)